MNRATKILNISLYMICLPLSYGLGNYRAYGTFLGYKTERYYAIRDYERGRLR